MADNPTSILSFFNLSDHYERKARFVPAVLTLVFLLPAATALTIPLSEWLTALVGGIGVSAALAVGLSHVASAMGNRYQRHLWPDWPHDAPTHRRLHPSDTSHSQQQRDQWILAIKNLTGLDIAAAVTQSTPEGLDAIINDAVVQVRTRLWRSPHAD
ncbi:MAG: hypothetical protein AB7O59_24455 [Pirellulales bacterium]